jgi:hypothetical protein
MTFKLAEDNSGKIASTPTEDLIHLIGLIL